MGSEVWKASTRWSAEEISLETAAGVPPCGALEEEFVVNSTINSTVNSNGTINSTVNSNGTINSTVNSNGTRKPLESFFKKKKHVLLYFYLFSAALGLHRLVRAFFSCGERGLLFVAVHRLLAAVASRCRTRAPGVGSSCCSTQPQ